jgi:hypothetical protein
MSVCMLSSHVIWKVACCVLPLLFTQLHSQAARAGGDQLVGCVGMCWLQFMSEWEETVEAVLLNKKVPRNAVIDEICLKRTKVLLTTAE